MHKDADLLAVIYAVRTGLVTREQVSECGTFWKGDGRKTLTDLLTEQGFLKPGGRQAVEALVRSKVEEYGLKASDLISESQEIHQFIVDACSTEEPDLEETILEWSAPTPAEIMALDEAKKASAHLEDTAEVLPGGAASSSHGPPTEASLKAILGEKYDFQGELGRSGLCRVVQAVDRDFHRTVAIKMLLPGHSIDALESFQKEGRTMGRLVHPNIVPVFEIGSIKQPEGEAPYFAMAKIEGQDLQGVFHDLTVGGEEAARKYSRGRLLRAFQQACDAIAYAHEQGVVHRDLKTVDVMVGDNGQAFVVGWGRGGESEAGEDRRADIAALGAILKDILSAGDGAAPLELGAIMGKAAAAAKGGGGYASARELGDALQRFLEN